MKPILYIIIGITPLLLASCGTTSPLTNAQGAKVTDSTRKFTKATIQNFGSSIADPDGKVASAQTYFADRIMTEMKKMADTAASLATRGPTLKPWWWMVSSLATRKAALRCVS